MKKVSRREFAVTTAAALTGALTANTAEAQGPSTAATAPGEDVRVRLIEKSRGKDFTPEQRQAVQNNILNTDKQWAEGRKFQVPDNTEPAFVFVPTPLSRGRAK